MLIDFAQIKNGLQTVANVAQLRTDLDGLPIDYMQTETVSDTFTGAVLKRTPTADPVALVINSLVYVEGDGFTVDRTTKTLTWTDTELTITASVADEVQIHFKTPDRADTATGPVVDP